ncbi:MAG: LysR family transcriptional regulator [Polyangiaceae bacterium]
MESSDFGMLVALDALLQEGSVTGAARRVGLSTPAMSHALARIRERMADPILVRSGRGMLLTPRGLALKPRVHEVVEAARRTLEPEKPFVARELSRTFVIHATDYVLTVLGATVDRILADEAPDVALRFVPNAPDDVERLRDRGSDLAVGIYGKLPDEMIHRQLLTDRFVCVARRGHPEIGSRFTLEDFVRIPHVQVAPRGLPGGYIDDVLAERKLRRTVARAVPYFLTALQMASETNYLLTISERIARRYEASLGLRILEVPLKLRPYALSLVWHPRVDADPGQRFLRDVFARAASEKAGERHDKPRTRLDPTDPASGHVRKDRRKASLHRTKR